MIDAAIEQDGTASRRLIEAICELVGEGGVEQGKPKPTALGNAIRQFQGRNFANLRAEWNGRSNSGSRWKLVRMEPPRP